MSEAIYIGKNAATLEQSDALTAFSKVVIYLDDNETQYVEAGDESGRTLTMHCPWATQQTANNIIQGLAGFQYKPYTASNAHLNPAAQLGDAITVDDVYSGIYGMNITYGRGFTATVSAPNDEEIDHEYPYEYIADRTITRSLARHESDLTVQAHEIAAKVSRVGSNDSRSFSWSLTEDGFVVASNGNPVMTITENGAVFNGKIEATSGFIGNKKIDEDGNEYTDGFYITASAMYNGMTSLNDTKHTGIYIGSDGIALGGGKIVMDASTGKLTCKDISITGGSISGGSIGGSATVGGFSAGTVGSGGNAFSEATNTAFRTRPNYFYCNNLDATRISLNGSDLGTTTIYYTGQDGSARSAQVVLWR